MEGVTKLEMTPEDAEQEYKAYVEAVKTRKEKYLEDLKKVYYNLKRGRNVIDIFSAMKIAGTNEQGEPNLAIVRADVPVVYFHKQSEGSGYFCWTKRKNVSWGDDPTRGSYGPVAEDVQLPGDTWKKWEEMEDTRWAEIVRPIIKANVPTVPAHLLPQKPLEGFYILFEPSEWSTTKLPKADPFLLKRINLNMFAVFAEWDLTPIELAVINGRIG